MTREEAIQICKEVRHCLWIADEQKTTTIWDKGAVSEAMLMAIEALKQVTGKLNDPDDSLLTADSEACKEQKSKLDLISRAEAIEAIEIVDWYHQNSNKDMVHGANSDEHQAWYKADDVYKALEAVPSADRPRGEWVRTDFEDCVDGERIKWARWNCSECGVEKKIGWVKDVNFCPNCGADMRGEDE